MVIFLYLDGSAQKVTPDRIFQGSNNVTDVTVVAPYPSTTALEIGFILPDGYQTAYTPMQFVEQQYHARLGVWQTTLKASATALMGDLLIAINAVTLQGNKTSFLVKAVVEESVLPVLPPEPEPDIYHLLLLWIQSLDERLTAAESILAEDLVNDIKKVIGVDNAFYYTTTHGVISAPIIIGGGSNPPAYEMAASTVNIPASAWQPRYSGPEITDYYYVMNAGVHGQMKNGATAKDLWVSFLDAASSSPYEVKSCFPDEEGNLTITVNEPVDLTVRVWNGLGIQGADYEARQQIDEEITRAKAAEEDLQTQITEEAARAKTAEDDLDTKIGTEVTRAQEAEENLQTQIDAVSGTVGSVPFPATGWTTANNAFGALTLGITVPSGKRIVQVLDSNNAPRGAWQGSAIYANEAFAGVAIVVG